MARRLWATRADLAMLLALALWAGPAAAGLPPDSARSEHDLYLDVVINGTNVGLIAAFRQRSDGTLAITPEELGEIALNSGGARPSADGLIELTRVPCLAYRYDAVGQQIFISAESGCRAKSVILGGGAPRDLPRADDESTGAVLNYTAFATSYGDLHDIDRFRDHDPVLSIGFDAWTYGPWGTITQTGFISTDGSAFGDAVRLDTVWAFSDPNTLVTYRAGDVIAGGLAWTRPIRLGGVQVQRDFALRPDLVTMPVPSLSGSAAVPSTIDVYANNMRVYSGSVPAGPFEIASLPVIAGAGMAQVVINDTLGRETVTTIPYYASPELLKPGFYDFSLEAGFPRTYYGTLSDNYEGDPALMATLRYGLADWLTLETHGEASAELLNVGAGLAAPLGPFGLATAAAAASRTADHAGMQVAGGLEFHAGPLALVLRGQKTYGDYADLASVSAGPRVPGDFGLPERLLQGALSIALPFDPATLTLSYTELATRDLEHAIVGASLSRPLFGTSSLFVSGSVDLADHDSALVYLGLSTPLGAGLSTNASMSLNNERVAAGVEVAKSERDEAGSVGWRLREREGTAPDRMAAASYRGSAGRVEGRVHQLGDAVSVSAQTDGGIAITDGGVFLAPRIAGAFAVVDTGVPDTEVRVHNRPVGRTDDNGRLLVTNLSPYQANAISIDPTSLPLDADIPKTKDIAVPGRRRGTTAKFAVTPASPSALVVLSAADGSVLAPGSRVTLAETSEAFVLGYDGEVFVRNLGARNTLVVERADGSTCAAQVPFGGSDGEQVVIPAVCE
jgi:outer membrane usher protein